MGLPGPKAMHLGIYLRVSVRGEPRRSQPGVCEEMQPLPHHCLALFVDNDLDRLKEVAESLP